MAKKNSIEDALNDVLNSVDSVVDSSVKEAGRTIQKDLLKKTKEIIKNYYDEYPERKFDPIYSLYKSFNYRNTTRGRSINVEVFFNSKNLDGLHESNSIYHESGAPWVSIDWRKSKPENGKQYGAVESSFIFDNFWHGVHPKTLGNKYRGFDYYEIIKGKSPEDQFADYIETYDEKKVNDIFSSVFIEKAIDAIYKSLNGGEF